MILPKQASGFSATIELPSSKSLSNRWLMLNACLDTKIPLHNLSNALDTKILQDLLHRISQFKNSSKPVDIHCKNAGTVLRFLTPFLSVMPGTWVMTGDERLSVRPIADLVEALQQLGAKISYIDRPGRLPLLITGISEFTGSCVNLNLSKSSQFATALMLIISKFPNGLQIHLEGQISSKPYLEMTAKILEQCGVDVIRSETHIVLKNPPKPLSSMFIESDWTAASYFYACVALSGQGVVEIENLYAQSLQGDAILAAWFEQFGVETTFVDHKAILKKKSTPFLTELHLDFRDYPDLAQTFAVVCAAKNIPARLTGLSSLRYKETDRLYALSHELNQIGATNIIEKDALILYPHGKLNFSTPIATYSDHRMAMAFSVFSSLYQGVNILHPEVVNKSFPDFWQQIQKLQP